VAPALAVLHQHIPIQHGADRADRGRLDHRELPDQLASEQARPQFRHSGMPDAKIGQLFNH
jgi:hypothetical protein